MKILVGLGNPGKEYENTRHNAGRIMVGLVQKKISAKGAAPAGGQGPASGWKFVTPDTFMNNSGPVVANALAGKKALKDLVVVYDDIDLPLGKVKISFNRSSGGHNGLGSVIRALKSEEFVRIRIGISPATPSGKVKKPKGEKAVINFILGEFKKSELDILKKLSKKVAEIVEMVFFEGKDKAMSIYN